MSVSLRHRAAQIWPTREEVKEDHGKFGTNLTDKAHNFRGDEADSKSCKGNCNYSSSSTL